MLVMVLLPHDTRPETNIFAPENGWLEYYVPIGEAYFQGLWLLVSGRVVFLTVHLTKSLSKFFTFDVPSKL